MNQRWMRIPPGVAALVFLGGCMSKAPELESGDPLTAFSVGGTFTAPPAPGMIQQGHWIGNRNSLLKHYTGLTRAPASLATKNLFGLLQSSLPLDGRPTEQTGAAQISMTALAGGACDDLFTYESANPANRYYYTAVTFTGNQVNASLMVPQVIVKLTQGFWGRNPTQTERTELTDLVLNADFLPSPTIATQTQQRSALLALCTATLSSLQAQLK